MIKPWNYEKRVKEFLKSDTKVLVMDETTTGDDFFASFVHSKDLVRISTDVETVDFEENTADLILCQNEEYSHKMEMMKKVLKKGGHFITEQKGTKDPRFNLENQVTYLEEMGFRIVYGNQHYKSLNYTTNDVGHSFIIVAKLKK